MDANSGHKKIRKPWAEHFPNGEIVEKYGDYEKWSNRRWAWEFLRRNPEYIQACEEIGISVGKKVAGPRYGKSESIARTFGRLKLKHYLEPYGNDDATRNWTVESVIESDSGNDKIGRGEYELPPGWVSMLFDLSEIDTAGTASITAMLGHAKEILLAEAKKHNARDKVGPALAGSRPEARARRPDRNPEARLLLLQVFDALEIYQTTTTKVAEKLVTATIEEADETDQVEASQKAEKKLSKLRVKARGYVNRGYLSLVPLDYIQDGSKKASGTSA